MAGYIALRRGQSVFETRGGTSMVQMMAEADTAGRIRIGEIYNGFAALPERFYSRQPPAKVPQPRLIAFNAPLAEALGLDLEALGADELAGLFAGNLLPEGAEPLAMAYAGHQFGNLVPQLGDGRALLLGEVIARDGSRRDIQLKGSGRTLFSRGGDGKAALGPVLREYLISEAMHGLGVPSTRALAAVATGEPVPRDGFLRPGAVLTRVLASNLRVGTFQYFAIRGDTDGVRLLADYAIERHYPRLAREANPYLAFLNTVIERQAGLIAQWLNIGFIHGVMNTDNTTISGETIDYGPCAFVDAYEPATVFSSIDQTGRYAYGNQPYIAQWNLARLAETLLPLLDPTEQTAIGLAEAALKRFPEQFNRAWLAGMRRKLGLPQEDPTDAALVQDLLELMRLNKVDFTAFFRRLCDLAGDGPDEPVAELFQDWPAFAPWRARWQTRLEASPMPAEARREMMQRVNPAFIPRNHLVEHALAAAVENDDLAPFHTLFKVLQRPFDDQPEFAPYAAVPPACDQPYMTFCGT
jgi:uncharacterized protein YdiU (UPF0061 family)